MEGDAGEAKRRTVRTGTGVLAILLSVIIRQQWPSLNQGVYSKPAVGRGKIKLLAEEEQVKRVAIVGQSHWALNNGASTCCRPPAGAHSG